LDNFFSDKIEKIAKQRFLLFAESFNFSNLNLIQAKVNETFKMADCQKCTCLSGGKLDCRHGKD